MKKQTKVWLSLAISVSLLVLAAACGGSKEPATNEAGTESASTAKAPPTSGLGTITGVISFEGAPPAAKKIDTSADPVCGQKNPNLSTEDTVVKDGKLANVFVYIKDGAAADGTKIGDYAWTAPATGVTLDQTGCHYKPHVVGIQTKQKLSITNSDPTQHNIHWTPTKNPEWNQSQPNGAPAIEKTFNQAEVMVPVKCNQHPWMKSYIGVMKTPFFAVSAEDGTFSIKGVPAGTYTVVAWKEGGQGQTKEMSVTVAANGSATASFAFGAATASNSSVLPLMPAIDFPMLQRH